VAEKEKVNIEVAKESCELKLSCRGRDRIAELDRPMGITAVTLEMPK
jgi:hypothetical protein